MDNPPIRTLYLRNLNEKVGAQELKRRVRVLVSRYASVLDVVVRKAMRLRGQAFVTLGSVQEAELVKSLLHKFFFLGRTVEVYFARSTTKGYGEKPSLRSTKTLVVKNLEQSVQKHDLEEAFQDEEGLARVRYVSVKRVALVDFWDEASCARCFSRHERDGVLVLGKLYKIEML